VHASLNGGITEETFVPMTRDYDVAAPGFKHMPYVPRLDSLANSRFSQMTATINGDTLPFASVIHTRWENGSELPGTGPGWLLPDLNGDSLKRATVTLFEQRPRYYE
jgi:hypothetical protein